MNPIWGHLIGASIVILMCSFIGIWVWAWLPHHRNTFARLAQVPMEDPLHYSAGCPVARSAGTGDEDARR